MAELWFKVEIAELKYGGFGVGVDLVVGEFF